jgi:hypothetical protein
MTFSRLTGLTCSLLLAGIPAASAGSANGSAALALAGLVAPYSPVLSPAEKKVVAAFLAGQTSAPYAKEILVTADKIICRTSNVDIAARSCELTFGNTVRKFRGREANELYTTAAMAGVPSDGAAGSIFESVSKLSCTLDPAQINEKAGAGADCSYETAK